MDIEHLSKSQIVLLTLLVSFVTSIATGIVTVSLMAQAPPAIAQTVNRVIERTIQTVVSTSTRGQAAASVVTQEKTVVVKESDLISKAIERVNPSIVRLYSSATESPAFLGIGVVIDGSGSIVSDSSAIGEAVSAVAELSDKTHVRAFVSSANATSGLVYFVTATSTIEGKSVTWTPISIAGNHPTLGETVVVLAGKTVARIAAGLITTLVSSSDETAPQTIETDIAPDSILSGSPLIDTDGSLLGISTGVSRAVSPAGFISASTLMKAEKKKTQ